MWWVKEHPDHRRGGFQNRDVGKTNFDDDYGPTYGTDYARYSDPPNLAQDAKTKEIVLKQLSDDYPDIEGLEVSVRNGFVLLKGRVVGEEERQSIINATRMLEGVKEVINQLVIIT